MPPRKFTKLSSVSASREAFADSDDEEQHSTPASEWIKLTSRVVDRDVGSAFRFRKKSQFTEENEEVEVSSKPLVSFSISSAQSAHFSAWIDSANGAPDDTPPDDYDDSNEVDLDRNPTDDVESDGYSSYDQDEEPQEMEHDIADFVAEKEAQVRRS